VNKMIRIISFAIVFCVLVIFITGCNSSGKYDSNSDIAVTSKAFERNKRIGRGMNFGNALEGPSEGEWGLVIKELYIEAVADAGFDSVRLPICWSAHTDNKYPYLIDKNFLSRVDEIIGWCFERDLAVVITIHHFNELYNEPDNSTYRNMIVAIWEQLTSYFIDYDHRKLFFEVLNEPHNNLTAEKWNKLIPDLIKAVRAKDKDRTIIIDTADYGYHTSLDKLIIPEDERNVIISVRYYLPYKFTHQGGHWVAGSEEWLGETWSGTDSQKNTVDTDLKFVKAWSVKNNRPITIGEFGAIINADEKSRLVWTEYVRGKFEENGFSWSYFDFGVRFRAYDIEKNCWLDGFKEALVAKR